MALVMEVRSGNAVAYVYDDAYRGITQEEMAARKLRMREAMGRIAAAPGAAERVEEYRRREAEKAGTADGVSVIWHNQG